MINKTGRISDNDLYLELSEYFYHYRKLWKDVKQRFEENQFSGVDEKIAILKRAKARKLISKPKFIQKNQTKYNFQYNFWYNSGKTAVRDICQSTVPHF